MCVLAAVLRAVNDILTGNCTVLHVEVVDVEIQIELWRKELVVVQ